MVLRDDHRLVRKPLDEKVNMAFKTITEADVWQKLNSLDLDIEKALRLTDAKNLIFPKQPGRGPLICKIEEMPNKTPLQDDLGQRRLIHDLAHIEMQAMELGLRTLSEYPQTPKEFKFKLIEIIKDEARHLSLLIKALEERGGHWGEFPVHLSLWSAVSTEDSLLDRLLIVHRYLEGSGLDAGDKILKKLYGSGAKDLLKIVKVIVDEEIGHVKFGSDWFNVFCKQNHLDPDHFFISRMEELKHKLPKRMLKINLKARQQAGFSDVEIEYLKKGVGN